MFDLIKKMIPESVFRAKRLWDKKGNKYHCPFCGYAANELSPVGHDLPVITERQVIGAGRRAGGCYKCLSSDRERLIYAYLKHRTDVLSRKDMSILHVAPEENLSKFLRKQHYREYICGDLFAPGYVYPDHVQNIDVVEIPFGNDRFDLVICNHVLEHVPDDARAMREIYRVLKPGSTAILQVPVSRISDHTVEDPTITDPKLREKYFGQHDHVRIYGNDYPVRLKQAGFEVTVLELYNEFKQYGLNPDEGIFICKKE
ncbi:MAG: class I SAM-dependent methyltransferase [Bacteroidota bacterium]|nr:class I SAM-dependent methyltransferase [Bacteroidota bacterium]